ncbi:DNA-binding transcriptional MocR family regulator [Silvimonas terrae]|uniref:Putative 8-amino-7-oxononanoate synthase n=1 Tax=Silvimonas terrae TaxID=300266 RepID=A0A840RKD1_9NEIS|nr:PLP-dependent aminotransferase family protein [Silvimonas terrae]MBB5192978.1 DNA-binding transcriptional MocR family regulator [Silvimonas terrae]
MDHFPLYRQLASHYRQAIEAGTLRAGERMPSVRTLMERHDVSLSTALQTCRYLESQGIVEARPRSGYFVCHKPRSALARVAEPGIALPDTAQYVGINEKVSAILVQAMNAKVQTNLGVACGAPELYPNEPLRQAAVRALRQSPEIYGRAVPRNGYPGLRAVLAKRAMHASMNLSADDIVITHGCTEALNLAIRAVAQPGDIIAVESPTFYGVLQILESLGMRALEIPTSPQTGISLEALELAARTYNNIKAVVVVPHLQNPLGAIMPESHKDRLVTWCEANRIALIEDDTYALLTDDDTPLPALKSRDHTGNVIHCASLHKTVAPGMRVGWMSAGKWRGRVEMLKYAHSRPNESLSQQVAASFLGSGAFDRHLRRLRTHLYTQRQQVAQAIDGYFPAGTRLTVPAGGFGLWVELPDQRDSQAVFESALEQGIRVAPGIMFSNSSRFASFLRISCGTPYNSELDQAVRKLARIVDGARRLPDLPAQV